MNENENQKVVDVMAKEILSHTIEEQNNIFAMLRETLISERRAYLKAKMEEHGIAGEHIDFADKTLHSVFMCPISDPDAIGCTVSK